MLTTSSTRQTIPASPQPRFHQAEPRSHPDAHSPFPPEPLHSPHEPCHVTSMLSTASRIMGDSCDNFQPYKEDRSIDLVGFFRTNFLEQPPSRADAVNWSFKFA
ncbi:hypothetical protein BaRGS_00004570 [Batillaria attramentaria]|uniref:Uncharacterized protein n=1 Tax=Batillaria attramentaria TaxID=370345 RepID=A0ABD0LXS6_9CAEN